jgi:FkbM family methyltransferase
MGTKLNLVDKLIRLPFLKKFVRHLAIKITSVSAIRKALRSASQAGKLSQGVWQWLPISLTFQVRLPAGQEFSYSVVPGDGIGKALYWQGVEFLGGEFQAFYRMITRSHFFVDVGANTGTFSLIACATNSGIRAIAFEPVPEIYERLVTNVTINAFQGRCQMVQKAVSDVAGTARLLVPPGEISTEATLELQSRSVPGSGTHIDIVSTTLDVACAQVAVDFIKIDVEGAEYKVLQGARRLLARCRPTILLEHHVNCPDSAIESVLEPYGYLFYRVSDDGSLAPVERLRHGIREYYLCSCLALEAMQGSEAGPLTIC